eukprot:COSAG01_NODE_5744_length_4062_cov_8.080242_3_plen_125_part_00
MTRVFPASHCIQCLFRKTFDVDIMVGCVQLYATHVEELMILGAVVASAVATHDREKNPLSVVAVEADWIIFLQPANQLGGEIRMEKYPELLRAVAVRAHGAHVLRLTAHGAVVHLLRLDLLARF